MSDASIEREIGRLQAQSATQQKQLDAMNHKLDSMLEFMHGAKGSWRALVAVGAVSSFITAAVMKLCAMVFK